MTNLLGLWHDCLLLWNEWMNVLGMPRLLSDATAVLTTLCRWATARVLPFGSQHSGIKRAVSELWFHSGSESWCDTQPCKRTVTYCSGEFTTNKAYDRIWKNWEYGYLERLCSCEAVIESNKRCRPVCALYIIWSAFHGAVKLKYLLIDHSKTHLLMCFTVMWSCLWLREGIGFYHSVLFMGFLSQHHGQ